MIIRITVPGSLFNLADHCEIGGGYLVWLWRRIGAGRGFAASDGFVLLLYGIIPTYQPEHLGRVYAAYAGRHQETDGFM